MSSRELLRPIKRGILQDHLRLLLLFLLGGPFLPFLLAFSLLPLFRQKQYQWFTSQIAYKRHIAFLPGVDGQASRRRLSSALFYFFVLPLLIFWGTVFVLLQYEYITFVFGEIAFFTFPLSFLMFVIATMWLRGKYIFFQKPIDVDRTLSFEETAVYSSKYFKKNSSAFRSNLRLLMVVASFGPVFVPMLPISIGLLAFSQVRDWFMAQPGYIYYLSNLPGLNVASRRRLIWAMIFYFGLPIMLLYTLLYIIMFIFYFETLFIYVILVPLPLAFVSISIAFSWLTGRAGFFYEEMMADSADGTRVNTFGGATNTDRKASIDKFLGYSTFYNLTNNQRRGAVIAQRLASIPKYVWALLMIWAIPAFFMAYVWTGWLVAIVGAVLSFVPRYRHWLQRQPGTINRLGLMRGWRSENPFKLALAHMFYFGLLSAVLLFGVVLPVFESANASIFNEIVWYLDYLGYSAIPFALPLMLGWFIRYWRVPLPGINRLMGLNPGFRKWRRLHETAVSLKKEEKFAESIEQLNNTLTFAQTRFGPLHFTCAKTYNSLSQMYLLYGQYDDAVESYQKVLEISRKGFGEVDYYTANSEYRLGKLYIHLGKFTEAIPYFKDALNTYRVLGGESNRFYGRTLNDLGYAYLNLNHLEIAEALFAEAAEIQAQRFPQDLADTENHLALIHTMLGEYEQAERHFINLEKNPDATYVPDMVESWIWINRAYYYQQTDEYHKALYWQEKALDKERSLYHDNHLTVGKYLRQMADILREMGRYDEALNYYVDAQGIYFLHGENTHPEFLNCLYGLAKLKAAMGEPRQAFELMKTAIDSEEGIVGKTLTFGSENGRLSYLQSQHDKMIIFLELIRQYLIDDQTALTSAGLILRRQSLVADISSLVKQTHLLDDPKAQKISEQLKALNDEIGRLESDGAKKEQASAVYKRDLRSKRAERERIETELSNQLPFEEFVGKIGRANWESVGQALPESTLLLQFVYGKRYDFTAVPARNEPSWTDPGYMLFALPYGETVPHLVDLGSAKEINEVIKLLRRRIDQMRRSAGVGDDGIKMSEYTIAGLALYQKLLEPIKGLIKEDTHLLIVPDGMLASLPFEILPVDNDRYLLELCQVSYLSTARDLFCDYQTEHQSDPVIIADPDYNLLRNTITADGQAVTRAIPLDDFDHVLQDDNVVLTESHSEEVEQLLEAAPYLTRGGDDRGSIYFTDLKNTHEEGEAIASMLQVEAHLDGMANELNLKKNVSPKVLHIATHGFFLEKKNELKEGVDNRLAQLQLQADPLVRAGLALAGANRWLRNEKVGETNENGILTGLDVVGLNLTGTKLVVLSACDTGLGDYVDGEGVFGLRRAFVMAGAHTLVMSMWKVPDAQTKDLMVKFYKHLLDDQMPRAAALRKAQLAIRSNPETAHPYYWGAFICQGMHQPLEGGELEDSYRVD